MKYFRSTLLGLLLLVATHAHAQSVFNKYGPVAGIQKSTGSSYVNTAASSADLLGVIGTVGVPNGGTGLATLTVHGVMLGEGTANVAAVAAMSLDTVLVGKGASADPAALAIGSCSTASSALTYNTSTHVFGCNSITAAPGGSSTQIQYNNGSAFGGASNFTYTVGTGDVAITAPSSGIPLTITDTGSTTGFRFTDGTGTLDALVDGSHNFSFGPTTSGSLTLLGGNVSNVILSSTGATVGTAWNFLTAPTFPVGFGGTASSNTTLASTLTNSNTGTTAAQTFVLANSLHSMTMGETGSGFTGLPCPGCLSGEGGWIYVTGTGSTTGNLSLEASANMALLANGSIDFQITGSTGALSGRGPTAAGLVDMTPDTGTFTSTFTGLTTAVTCTSTWSRIGKLVTLALCAGSGTSNSTSFGMTGLPAAIQPASISQSISLPGGDILNNGVGVFTTGALSMRITAASGTVSFVFNGGSNWTATGAKGFAITVTVSYLLN